MILRFFETIIILYCLASYIGCTIVLIANWNKRAELFGKAVSKAELVLSAIIFLVLAPLMVADVIIQRLKRIEQ